MFLASASDRVHRVYFIDHDASVRQKLSALFKSALIEYEGYTSVPAFVGEYRDEGAACIITAIRLPGLSGLQLLENAKTWGVTHPIMVLTAYADVPTTIQAFRYGAVDFFQKPVSDSLLLSRVQKWIHKDKAKRRKDDTRQRLSERIQLLSLRERHILSMLLYGLANKEVAWKLDLTKQTVSSHRTSILNKMGSDNLTHLIVQISAAGLLEKIQNLSESNSRVEPPCEMWTCSP